MRPQLRLLAFSLLSAAAHSAQADPIKIHPVQVTASNTWSSSAIAYAVDGDPSTAWNSGNWAPQWIQLDLGRPMPIEKIRLTMLQSPTGNSAGTIAVGQTAGSLTTAYSWNTWTYDGEPLEFSGDNGTYRGGNVRYIRITTTSSVSWIGWREIEVFGGPEYLGYFASNDYITETWQAGANLAWVPGDTSVMNSYLAQTQAHGSKAMVDVSFLLDSGVLPTDWQAEVDDIANHIINGGYQSTVAAFYLRDEPYGNWAGHPPSNKGDIDRLAAYIKSKPALALTKMAAIVSIPELSAPAGQLCQKDGTAVSPNGKCYESYDWVGFDCYGNWNGPICNMPYWTATMRSMLSSSQRLIAVPQSIAPWGDVSDSGLAGQSQLIENTLDPWQTEITSDAKYVAIIPWLWQNYENGVGAQNLPWVKERLNQLALTYLVDGNTQVFPTSYDASGSYTGYYKFAGFDRDTSDFWNSGQFPYSPYPYLQANFGGPTRVTHIELTVEQDRFSSPTAHYLYGWDGSAWHQFASFVGYTNDNQVLVWNGVSDYSAIKVETDQSPAWVCWREIKFTR